MQDTKQQNNLTQLCQLAIKYGNDRHPLSNKHSYTPVYFNLFKDKRESVKKVLEIGVGEGAGLKMWRDFFPNATIYGADIEESRIFTDERIKVFKCDQSNGNDLLELLKNIGTDLDIVIDDGSHKTHDQVFTYLTIAPQLKDDAVYIIEDISEPEITRKILHDYQPFFPELLPMGRKYDNHMAVLSNIKFDPVLFKLNSSQKKSEKVSIIIPSRNESLEYLPGFTVLQKTVQEIYEKATGDFEVLVGFDGPPYQEFPNYPNLKLVKFPETVGIKIMINALASMAQGKYIYKSDAHCSFDKGFDEKLQLGMQEDWIVTPRFYVLNPKTWEWQDDRHYDYFYLCCPFTDPRGLRFKAGGHWPERTTEREKDPKYDIDETPQIHGSGWFMSKDYFFNTLGGFPNIDPYGHAQEPIWLALKNWLAGGKVMVNKNTWYAHMHQQATNRGYTMSISQTEISYKVAAEYWLSNQWHERKYDFEWFIKKFMPMPSWPDNWEEILSNWQKKTYK